jgi:hypothetical protein
VDDAKLALVSRPHRLRSVDDYSTGDCIDMTNRTKPWYNRNHIAWIEHYRIVRIIYFRTWMKFRHSKVGQKLMPPSYPTTGEWLGGKGNTFDPNRERSPR